MELDDLVRQADIITVHLPKTPETAGLIGAELLAQAKPDVRIVNTARGGIVDEAALSEAIAAGTIAGAALDVFAEEPTTSSPLFEHDSVVVTPHLGASTREAQDKAGITIAEQVLLALAGDFVPFAVNVSASEASETVRPFLSLAERVGRFFAELSGRLPAVLEIEYQGGLADYDVSILTLSVLKGLFGAGTDEPVSYVNAPQIAAERGVEIRETKAPSAHDYVNLITLRGGDHSVAGTLFGLKGEHRLVMIDEHTVEIPPARHMLVARNEDRPGRAAAVLSVLGDAGINVSDIHLGRSPSGEAALMVLAVDDTVAPDVLERVRALDGIISAQPVSGG
jgi:D-3-phosphoglycerate dehydrogenase